MGAIGTDLYKYINDGKIIGRQSSKFPDGAGQEFGSVIQEYIAGQIDEGQWEVKMQAAWDKLK